MKVGDLVYLDRLWRRHELGVVVGFYQVGMKSNHLRVLMTDGSERIASSDEWRKV